MRTTTLLTAVLFLAGCEANDLIKPASQIKIGMTEQQAIATAGSPTEWCCDYVFEDLIEICWMYTRYTPFRPSIHADHASRMVEVSL